MSGLKTEDIRPHEAEQRYLELYRQEISALIDPETGMVENRLLSERSCPVCESTSSEYQFVKDGFHFVKCKECHLLYVNPSLRESALKAYYEDSKAIDFFQQYILMPTRQVRNQNIFKPRVAFIEQYCSGGRLLDVGCAVGNFLECLKDRPGWEISGVEPNRGAADFVERELGIPVAKCLLEETDFPEATFDVITFWETVEHIQDPIGLLKYCYKLLKKGGVFFVSTPNIAGFEFQVAGKDHFNIAAPNHLNYFSPETMCRLLNRAGFTEIKITTPGKLDVENIKILLKQGYGSDIVGSFWKDIILGDGPVNEKLRTDLQRLIVDNNLSGNMVAVCRK